MTIPTAKEFIEKYNEENGTTYSVDDATIDFMIEFAKLHVEKQKKKKKKKTTKWKNLF